MEADEIRRVIRISIAKETGWTLDYIDGLSLADIGDFLAHAEGEKKILDAGKKK